LQRKPNLRVAIVGIGQTRYEIKEEQTIPELVYEAVQRALQDAKRSIQDIDNVVTASVDLWDGLTASNVAVTEVVGAVMKPEARISADGSLACVQACMNLLADAYKTTLVVAHCKGSMSDHFNLTNWTLDPIYQQPLGLDDLTAAALQARVCLQNRQFTQEECASVVVRSRRNAKNNLCAYMREEVTEEDILHSPILADPIRELEIAPGCDGACALVLTRDGQACKITDKPIWIQGMGYCLEDHYLGDRDLADLRALREAARRAYAMAGVTDPIKQINFVELTTPFAYQELLWLKALGMAGIDLAVVNPSGGMLAGTPPFVAGLARIAEAALHLRAETNQYQRTRARTALAHGCWGPAGQGHCVLILFNESLAG
jgi:acetyl-CoA C-acetyltransferase